METIHMPAIRTKKELQDQISDYNQGLAESIQKKIEQMDVACLMMIKKTIELGFKVPAIIEALSEQGLGITKMSHGKSGNAEVWSENDKLHVTILAAPLSGKFRFIKFNGYTAGGSGKNENKLREKAHGLNVFMQGKIGLNCKVNQCTLEYHNEKENANNQVIFEFWI